MRSKHEREVLEYREKQHSNQVVWGQLQEAQKRERVLQQELLLTQQQVADVQRKNEQLQTAINQIDLERCRLQKFKSSKQDTLRELEQVVKQVSLVENIDVDKLVGILADREQQLAELRQEYSAHGANLARVTQQRDQEVAKCRRLL